jgi:hypothetical protein
MAWGTPGNKYGSWNFSFCVPVRSEISTTPTSKLYWLWGTTKKKHSLICWFNFINHTSVPSWRNELSPKRGAGGVCMWVYGTYWRYSGTKCEESVSNWERRTNIIGDEITSWGRSYYLLYIHIYVAKSVWGQATSWATGVQFLDLSTASRPVSGSHPASYPMGTGVSFRGGEAAENIMRHRPISRQRLDKHLPAETDSW